MTTNEELRAHAGRELAALRRVWAAMGCERNPDDFKQSVRDLMWATVVHSCEEAAAGATRVQRENASLEAELFALRAQVERVEAMAEEMGEGKAFTILTMGSESEYPISYFIEELEKALDAT